MEEHMRKRVTALLVTIVALALPFALAQTETVDEWMQRAEVGPYQPDVEDWDRIYELAREEGRVVVYSATPLILDAAVGFMERYPGIEVEAFDVRALDLLEKVRREYESGIYNADVINVGSPEIIRQSLEEIDAVVNYVPRDMMDVIPEQFREPYLFQRMNAIGWAYNPDQHDEPPFTNWWELTEPQWQGRIVHDSPARSFSTLQFAIAVVQHADEFAAAYERLYGEPIELTTPNAGYEYLKRLLENSVIGSGGSTGMAQAVTDSTGDFAALVVYSLYGQTLPGGQYRFEYNRDMDPAMGLAWGENQLLVTRSANPNAAKLLTRFMLDEGYFEHFARNPSPRTDVEPVEPYEKLGEMNWWTVDLDFAIEHGSDILDFWLTYQ
jgi:iron(III) transport system substrate-binding protein